MSPKSQAQQVMGGSELHGHVVELLKTLGNHRVLVGSKALSLPKGDLLQLKSRTKKKKACREPPFSKCCTSCGGGRKQVHHQCSADEKNHSQMQ